MKKVIDTRTEEVKIEITADFCDVCEKQLGEIQTEYGREWLYEQTATVKFQFGYLSSNSRDGDGGTFILCQDCAEDLHHHLETLSPNFKLTNYMDNLAHCYTDDIPE